MIRLVTARWVPSKRVRKAQIVRDEMDPNGSPADCHQFCHQTYDPGPSKFAPSDSGCRLRPLNGRSCFRSRVAGQDHSSAACTSAPAGCVPHTLLAARTAIGAQFAVQDVGNLGRHRVLIIHLQDDLIEAR